MRIIPAQESLTVEFKSDISKYPDSDISGFKLKAPESEAEKALMLLIASFGNMMKSAFEEIAPHRICAYIYELANDFNRFYHETRIIAEEDREKREGWIALLRICLRVFEYSIEALGMKSPERM